MCRFQSKRPFARDTPLVGMPFLRLSETAWWETDEFSKSKDVRPVRDNQGRTAFGHELLCSQLLFI